MTLLSPLLPLEICSVV
jgi:hypothetical protein